MKTVAILQARMSSNRLPGKVLMTAADKTVLDWVITAVRETVGVDEVCVAVPQGSLHDAVVDEAHRCGATTIRGNEADVLDRFMVAARQTEADIVMRVTTDCPMSDPRINAEVLRLLTETGADYACNNEPFSFPHGLDCEVFTRSTLEQAARMANDPYDREHVTPWIKRCPNLNRRYLIGPGGPQAAWRWTIDYPEDLEFFRSIVAILGEDIQDSAKIVALLKARPELLDINRNRRQRPEPGREMDYGGKV